MFINSEHEVAVHAFTHPFLDKIDSIDVMYEILEDRRHIERDYGVLARGMAYPFGTYSDLVLSIVVVILSLAHMKCWRITILNSG